MYLHFVVWPGMDQYTQLFRFSVMVFHVTSNKGNVSIRAIPYNYWTSLSEFVSQKSGYIVFHTYTRISSEIS